METEKKKFIKPLAEVIEFVNEDIITLSNLGVAEGEWEDEGNVEGM